MLEVAAAMWYDERCLFYLYLLETIQFQQHIFNMFCQRDLSSPCIQYCYEIK